MDFLIELIGEIFIEGLFELSTNKKVTKIVRYPLFILFVLLYLGIIGVLVLLGIKLYVKNKVASLLLWILATLLVVITLVSFRKKLK